MKNRPFIGGWGTRLGVVCIVLGLLGMFVGRGGSAVQGLLETPPPGSESFQSGIGLVRGWVCQANRVEVEVDEKIQVPAVYGEERGDTQGTCGDTNNGFSYQVNWGDLGEGPHKIRVLADGVEFGRALAVVATAGETFLRGAPTDNKSLDGFPQAGKKTTVQWQEAAQRFLLSNGGTADTGGSSPFQNARLESPAPGSFQSGIGLIRGWVCKPSQVTIELDGKLVVTAVYGEQRGDTQAICGDVENGFSYQVNWNEVGAGKHSVRALADGQEIGTATFTVVTLGLGSFVQGLTTDPFSIANFPRTGPNVQLRWDESLQNFQLTSALPSERNQEAFTNKTGTVIDKDGTTAALGWCNPGLFSGSTANVAVGGNNPNACDSSSGSRAERAQNGAGSFFLCDDLFSFTQGGRTFGPGEFRLLDLNGEEVCREIPAGETFRGVIVIDADSDLNFNGAYAVNYNDQPVVSFPAALPPSGNLGTSTTQVGFGAVPVGGSVDQTFTITNTGPTTVTTTLRTQEDPGASRAQDGTADVLIVGLTLIAQDGGYQAFTFVSPTGTSSSLTLVLPPGTSQTVTVRFTPVSNGPLSGFIRITSSGGSKTIAVSGTGGTVEAPTAPIPPKLAVFPTVLSFNVPVGSSEEQQFTVQNTGGGTLTGTLSTTSPFSLPHRQSTNFGDFNLGAGQSQTVTVRFTPTALGQVNGQVAVDSNGGTASVSLVGNGVSGVRVCNPLNFGFVAVGSSTSLPCKLSNDASAPLTVTVTTAPPFYVGSVGQVSQTLTLGAGASQDVIVFFAPTTPQSPQAGQLQVTVSTETQFVPLTGNTPPLLAVLCQAESGGVVDFGTVPSGSSVTRDCTVTNTGGGTLNGSVTVSPFFSSQALATFVLGPGESTTVTLTFAPKSCGGGSSLNGTAVFTSTNDGMVTKALQGVCS